MTRLHALTNTASGVAGEAAIAAAFLRAGFQVARPLWNDDEGDLLVFWERSGQLIPIPVQAKSVQSKVVRDAAKHTQRCDPIVAPQGLKKKYIDRQPALCLAIYSPERDKIWFFPGANSIREAYKEWLGSRSSRGRKSKAWNEMGDDYEVPIYVDVSKNGNAAFDDKWLLDRHSPTRLTDQVSQLAQQIFDQQQLRAVYANLFPAEPPEEDANVLAESELDDAGEVDMQ